MENIATRLGPWRIERTLGRDLSGVYYAACHDDGERATLYVLSDELTTGDEPLTRLLEVHREISHPGLIRFRGLDHAGSEYFLIGDVVDDALASLRRGHRPAPDQTLAFGAALAATLVAAHDHGLVHGGLELDNTLWAPDRAPQILAAGVAALGISDRVALARGDVAALGRLLCALVAGWQRRDAGGASRDHSTADSRTVELVRRLADPSTALSMREAHALLASEQPALAARRTGGIAELPTARGRGPRKAGDPTMPASAAAGKAESKDDVPDADLSGAGAAAEPDHASSYLGRYRILTRLGRGGMGEVFLAEDPALRRGVAIKRIRPGLERDRTFRARLRREAQLAARLNHRAIVQVFDLITHDNVDHVIMEYVPGPSLHTLLAGSAMAVAAVVRIAAELADGLAYAHQQDIVHRDLKVENILIGTDDQPKIADFGIARSIAAAGTSAAEESLTREGMMIGTTRAMSPEQIQGHEVDARSDLFSFGVLLYELVTGTSPFAADVNAVTILRVIHERPPSPRELVPDVPRALSDLIDHLLEKPPAQRPDSARAVRDRLRRILDDLPQPRRGPHAEPAPSATSTGSLPLTGDTPVAAQARGERRQVTLACIELSTSGDGGGDALTAPELIAEVLPAFRARVGEILTGFDGIQIGAIGHRIIACFGHPRPLEDAARRAVLAGRAMLAAAADLRSSDPVHARTRFTATGAVHTGLAVVRGSSAGKELVLGATLDAALQLLQLGGAGTLWLSDSATRLVETDFRLERPATLPQGMTSARRLVGDLVTGSASGEHDRLMVARDHELQLLLDSWRRARQGEGQVALLAGDPGIGKSRLTRELATAVAGDQPRRIILRGSSHRQRSALEPVTDAIAALLGLGAGAGPDAETAEALAAATERLRALTGPDEVEQILHLLGHPANLPAASPERARHQLLGGLRDLLVGTSQEVPTLLIVEDLHWLDPSTLDLIALVIQDVASSSLFLVMTTRPGVQPPWPTTATITQLRLGRLDASAIDAVIADACADHALPAAERALIAARSQGVPLYARELVRATLELGLAGEVPSTLRDALTARLHQLGPTTTRVAHIAAVAGREFTAELIAGTSGLDRASIDRELDRLVAVEILFRRRGRARDILYQFSHVLLQQAAYEELLADDRRSLHGQLADTLLADDRAGRDPGPELIAHHLAGAQRFAEAIAAAERAAVRSLGRHAQIEARELFRQALTWLDRLPGSDARDRTEIGLRMRLGAVLTATEGYTSPELERSCRRTEILCERHDDMPLPVKYGLWAVRLMRGSPDEVEPFVGWFEQVIDRNGPPIERMMAHASIGTYAYARASYATARHHLEHTMALFVPAEHAGVVQVYGGCGGFYGHIIITAVLWHTGQFEEAWRQTRSMVVLAETLDPYTLVCALLWEAGLHIAVGDTARTEALTERILELTTRYDFPYLACSALCDRGWVLARRGQAERALADLIMGTEGIKQIGSKVWYPAALGLLAESAIEVGQFDRAERALDEALEVCRTSVDRSNEPELLRLRGRLILRRDGAAHAPARAAFAHALAVAQSRGAVASALRSATELAVLLRDANLPEEAVAVLGPVYRGFAPCVDNPHLAAARQLLADLPASAA